VYGNPLPGCKVELYQTGTDVPLMSVISDAFGQYSFVVGNNGNAFYVRAYKAGTKDVFGTSSNQLQPI
jgi:hypothetical protein